jgi:hypothetical protein
MELYHMRKTALTIATIVIAGLATTPFAAGAKSYKHTKHHMSSMNKSAKAGSSTTTGANMKSSTSPSMRGDTSSDGNVGPGTTNNKTTGGR